MTPNCWAIARSGVRPAGFPSGGGGNNRQQPVAPDTVRGLEAGAAQHGEVLAQRTIEVVPLDVLGHVTDLVLGEVARRAPVRMPASHVHAVLRVGLAARGVDHEEATTADER